MKNDAIRAALIGAGYEFVQIEPKLSGLKDSSRPDVVGWAADSTGTLVPWVVVEAKRSRVPIHPELGLAQLARARDLLGTVDHYVVINDTDWYKADAGLQRLDRVDGPTAPAFGGEGEIADPDLLTALLSEELWKEASKTRDYGRPAVDYAFASDVTVDLSGFRTPMGTRIPVNKEALWEAKRRAVVDFARRGREGDEHTSPKVIAQAVARLAGRKLTRDLLDPFCGAGSFLWEAVDYAREQNTRLNSVLGYEINQQTAQVARFIGEAAPVPVEIKLADVFRAGDLPLSTCVVSAPPFGMRQSDPHRLLDGSTTRDGDLITVDTIVRLLRDGARAVVHLPASFTFRRTGESYRRFLVTQFRVAALVGLPSGALASTGIRTVLMVIDKAEPSDTFVAQLGEDWEAQLSPGGAALEAALSHIDGVC
jgi:hypothetical protein